MKNPSPIRSPFAPKSRAPNPDWFWRASYVIQICLLGGLAGACSKDPAYDWLKDGGAGTGGATRTGGTTGAGGAGGTGGSSAAAMMCDPKRSKLGTVDVPATLVSVGKPVVASAGVTNPAKVVDGLYDHTGAFFAAPTLDHPAWLAIDIGTGPERLLLSWADVGWNDYNTPITGGAPASYRIETSGDSTDGISGTWNTAADVPVNKVRERAHTFAFANQRWVKVIFTAAANTGTANAGVSIDEISIRDVTASGATARPADTWFFMGDSITAGAFRRQLGAGTGFDGQIRQQRSAFLPVMLDGGIGGELSTNGLGHLAEWLAVNPDIQHFAILYGTNDSWGVTAAASANLTTFASNMGAIVDMIIAAGRVPILARIPYATTAHTMLAPFNAVIDDIGATRGLPCGPDLNGWFRDHPEELSTDGVHPSEVGYRSINRLWAEAMLGLYPAN